MQLAWYPPPIHERFHELEKVFQAYISSSYNPCLHVCLICSHFYRNVTYRGVYWNISLWSFASPKPDPDQIIRSKASEKTWLQLRGEEQKFTYNVKATNQSNQEGYVKLPRTAVFTCINHALHWITSGRDLPLPPLHNVVELPDYPLPMDITKATHVQLLITGSLYLVGGVMSAIGYKADNE